MVLMNIFSLSTPKKGKISLDMLIIKMFLQLMNAQNGSFPNRHYIYYIQAGCVRTLVASLLTRFV